MEEQRTVHFEIQCENKLGEWVEIQKDRPKTEEEIALACCRALGMYPSEKVRVVRVTTMITVEDVSEEIRSHCLLPGIFPGKQRVPDRVGELLQDCD